MSATSPLFGSLGKMARAATYGSTISMMELESMMVPSGRISSTYSSRNAPTPRPPAAIHSTIACGVPLMASMRV
mgnify:CR=1 FL=1